MENGSLVQPNKPHGQPIGQSNESRSRAHDDTSPASPMHSGRLVYAKPQDLPSFPSVGVRPNGSAASAAATLGWNNQKSPEPWRPADKSASASAAAVLAKDYKMAPSWEPASSDHGARAALLASQAAKSSTTWTPQATSHGHSAANLAFKGGLGSPKPAGQERVQRTGSLYAAQGAMANRHRAKSSPAPREAYPDEAKASSNALAAATRAHKPGKASEVGGAVPYTTMDRQMFTSRPPVKPETDEQKRSDVLHASAVAMAKKMYTQQQKMIDARKAQAETSSFRGEDSDDEPQPMVFNSLQDAAFKQAQARLAKIHEDNMKTRDLHDYYGATPARRRLTIRDKLRRRASSEGDVSEDALRSQQIKRQMSIFSNKLSQVDEKKRGQDREALMAAAQRNVQAKLKGMDEKISSETGMVSSSSLTQWEQKAHAAALARSEDRADKHAGKVDVGAGLRMDQEAIDAIAARRVQPVLDEINEKAEAERARQEQIRLDNERKKEEQELEKARQKEVDDISKKLREQEKREQRERRAEAKQEAKAKKDEEKALRAEQKRRSKADHAEGQAEPKTAEETELTEPAGTVALNSNGQPVVLPRPETPVATTQDTRDEAADQEPKSPGDKSRGRVRSWFKTHFKGAKGPDGDKDKSNRKSFVGGAALTGLEGNESSASLDNRSASIHAVALAGRSQSARRADPDEQSIDEPDRAGAVSPFSSSSSSDDEFFRDEVRDSQPATALTPPKPFKDVSSTKSQSPVRDSKFHEII